MKNVILSAAVAFSLVAAAGAAQAEGCVKGAVVGGVAGHVAGHGKTGAAAGCAIGHHSANKKEKQAAAADQAGAQQPAQGATTAPAGK